MKNELTALIAADLDAEVAQRDEWYGLDNWTSEEVVAFVLDRARLYKEILR